MMRKWCLWSLSVCLCASIWLILTSQAWSAYITDVADSFDYENNNPFDFRLELSYQFFSETATIARERGTNPAQYFDYIPEFRVSHSKHSMIITPSIGLFHDLELKLWIPIVFSESFSGQPTTQATAQGSTLLDEKLVRAPQERFAHGPGIGDMSIGMQWGIFNDQRDSSKATWVIGMIWTIPTGPLWDPKNATSGQYLGVGRGAHVLTWHVMLSKRAFRFEPYGKIWYSLSLVTDGTKRSLQEGIYNAGTDLANRATSPRTIQNALAPGHRGGFLLGSEIVFWENTTRQQKLAIDVRFTGSGEFEGRNYSIFTDFLASYRPENAPLPRQSLIPDLEQNFSVAGTVALHFKMAQYGYIRIEGTVQHTFPFFITYAKRGVDLNNNRVVDPGTEEEYPYHTHLLDGIGKRVRQIDTLSWTLQIFAALTL